MNDPHTSPATRLRTVAVFALPAMCAVMLWGCAGAGRHLESPRVSVVDIAVKEMKPLEAVFDVEFRIFNTADLPLTIKGMHCDIRVNGTSFATGVSDSRITIAPFSTRLLSLTLYSSLANIVKSALSLQGKETVHYSMNGTLRLENEFPLPSRLSFESAGDLTIRGTPRTP